MVKIGPPSPAVNTNLDVLENYTYAFTAKETWEIINFFHEELGLLDIDDIMPEDRKCDICTEDFANNWPDLHRAVKLPCGHIFGKKCIEQWLTPFTTWHNLVPSLGANTCPNCRWVLFPQQSTLETPNALEARIRLWDFAYSQLQVRIELTDSEQRHRDDLMRYIRVGNHINRGMPSDLIRPQYIEWICGALKSFCEILKHQPLTPVQEQLRQGLEEIAIRGIQTRNDQDGVRFIRDEELGRLHFYARWDHQWDHLWDPVPSDEAHEGAGSEEQVEVEEEVEEEIIEDVEDDTEEMRFFRGMFR
ncbi:hypothetical protein MMC07_007797 [Pseudocyphellaria aurata]|nr:hypothetical protein [Pseudocyphellaria aurata]